ncbi:MAG TPA: DUF222 domain-containing protein [Nocardioides sp.]|uniref:HNH endonuclease n=1 Tax=Nocardioides sp. TaxID=35761 RepID=UPI002F41E93E
MAGDGAPTVAEFAVPEFAAALGLSPEAGKHYLGEALELAYRLPRLWARVRAGRLPGWKARRIARDTICLSVEAAGYVDRHLAPVAHKVGPAQLDRTVHEAIGRFMPEQVQRLAEASWDKRHVTVYDQLVSFTGTMSLDAELDIADALDLEAALTAGAAARAALGSVESLDVRRAQAVGDLARRQLALDLNSTHDDNDDDHRRSDDTPTRAVKPRQVVMYVHLSEAAIHGQGGEDPVARLERGNSLISVDQVRRWCGHPDAEVVVRPVIDLDSCVESDRVTEAIAEQVTLRDRSCVFPWCTRPARRCQAHPGDSQGRPCDRDHVIPRARNGPTCTCNIAALCRRHHRLKTHSPWTYLVLDPGTYLWTSPHGYQFLRDLDGTHDVSTDLSTGRPRPRLRLELSDPPDT